MDKALALKICPDFHPVPTDSGKVKCRFYGDDSLCKRPEYFRCELTLYREDEERKALAVPTISVSKAQTLLRCPRLYALNYIYKVDPPIPAKWKVVGRAFSECRAKIDSGLPYAFSNEIKSLPVDKARLGAVLRRYQEWRKPEYADALNEIRVFFPYKDVHFVGYIDELLRNRKTILEWKYAATEYDELKAVYQAATYFKGIPEAERFVLARAKKPQQRLKQAEKPTKKNPNPHDETPIELEERIYQELADKQHELFTYTIYDREFFDIEGTLEQIYQTAKLISAYEAASYPPAFGMNCENCDFRPYCLKHLTNIGCNRKFCGYPQICGEIKKMKQLPAEASASK